MGEQTNDFEMQNILGEVLYNMDAMDSTQVSLQTIGMLLLQEFRRSTKVITEEMQGIKSEIITIRNNINQVIVSSPTLLTENKANLEKEKFKINTVPETKKRKYSTNELPTTNVMQQKKYFQDFKQAPQNLEPNDRFQQKKENSALESQRSAIHTDSKSYGDPILNTNKPIQPSKCSFGARKNLHVGHNSIKQESSKPNSSRNSYEAVSTYELQQQVNISGKNCETTDSSVNFSTQSSTYECSHTNSFSVGKDTSIKGNTTEDDTSERGYSLKKSPVQKAASQLTKKYNKLNTAKQEMKFVNRKMSQKIEMHIKQGLPDQLSFVCVYCNGGFSRKGQLRKHIQTFHTETNVESQDMVKPWGCLLCKKGFASKSSITVHLKNVHGLTSDYQKFIEAKNMDNQE
ncbi:unnamed protein product [Clavelina lepadiformis]|uniref:C2H2-type domain-containing protein n=1 Tax=Clavelina lepadiformis TaxID=159417 RepID=A0ABP0FBC9_CLALP